MLRNVSTTVIQPNWLSTVEGDSFFKQIFGTASPPTRKLFGILEKPNIQMNYEEVSYKLFFFGKSSTEKSKVIAELIGGSAAPQETHGIRKTNVYWPTKIWDKIILFRLQCWEASDSGLKKFSHILPACLDKVDALVFIFSFEDANSLIEISQNVVKLKGKEPNQPAIVVVGTKYSTAKNLAVSLRDVKEFESKWHLNILRLAEATNTFELGRVSSVLNSVCESLWVRDQEYILKQSFDKFTLTE